MRETNTITYTSTLQMDVVIALGIIDAAYKNVKSS